MSLAPGTVIGNSLLQEMVRFGVLVLLKATSPKQLARTCRQGSFQVRPPTEQWVYLCRTPDRQGSCNQLHRSIISVLFGIATATPYPNLRTVHDLYFEPKSEGFRSRTIWSLSNAFTSVFKELDPIPQFKGGQRNWANSSKPDFPTRSSPEVCGRGKASALHFFVPRL